MCVMHLTEGEAIWLWRHRQGWTLKDAAEMWDINRGLLVDYEADRLEPPHWLKRRISNIVPDMPEQLRLLRRRAGFGLHGTAKKFGVSHVSLLRLERMGDQRLRRWYQHPDIEQFVEGPVPPTARVAGQCDRVGLD